MTIFIGSSDTTTFVNTDNYNSVGGTREYVRLLPCSGAANITTLALKVSALDQPLKLTMRNSSGTLLAVTSAISSLTGGWAIGTISSIAVTNGANYYLGFIASDFSELLNTDSTFDSDYSTEGTYASPAAAISSIVDDNGYQRFLMYADGTASGGAANQPWQLRGAQGVMVAM